MIGLVTCDTGTITIDGEELTAATAQEVRRGLGYVTQDGGLFPHLERPGERRPDGSLPGMGSPPDR